MDKDQKLQQYIEFCREIYEQMVRDDDWDWIELIEQDIGTDILD